MKAIAISGSPRKKNTDRILEKVLEGAASMGAETEMIRLYDLQFSGCKSCFYCKRKDTNHGICCLQDDLSEVLQKLKRADIVILGSPIYYGGLTGVMRLFLERFLFSNMLYDAKTTTFMSPRPTALITTYNATEEMAVKMGLDHSEFEMFLERMLGKVEYLRVYDTYQFDDYSKYEADKFDEIHKRNIRDTVFPEYEKLSYELGILLVKESERENA